MIKKQFFKLLLAILIFAAFTLLLNGCIVLIPSSPIVEINITNDNYTYEIRIDGNYYGTTDSSGKLTLYNVSTGYHYFEAFESPSILGRYGDKWQTITSGYNKVNIVTN